MTTRASSHASSGKMRFLWLYWPQVGNSFILLMSIAWFLRESTPASMALIFISAIIFIFALGYAAAIDRHSDSTATVFNWIGSLGGSLAFGIASPHFLPISLLCALEGSLCVLSLDGSGKRHLRAYSIATIGVFLVILLFSEIARNGHGLLDLQFTPAQIVVYQTIYVIGYSMVISRHIMRFFRTMRSTIARLSRSNDRLSVTERELQQRLFERNRLLEISRVVGSTQTLDALLKSTLAQLKTVVDFDRAAVLLLQDGEMNIIIDSGGVPTDQMLPIHFIKKPKYHAVLIAQSRPMLVTDLEQELPGSQFRGSWLGVPLIVRGHNIGILTLRHLQAGFYGHYHADLCMAFANQVAGLIDSARLQDAAASAMIVAERHRLARELHDSVSQSLFGIVLGVRTALEQVESMPSAARNAIDYSIRLADSALAEMRALIFTLRPEILERKGLIAALQNQIDLFLPLQEIRIVFTAPDTEPDCSPQAKEALYRIASEALRNAIRHSGCRSIEIRIETHPALRIDIIDDGRGFDPTADYENHLGLKSMHERAAAIGGRLEIDSGPGRGARISVEIPKSDAPPKLP